MCKGGQGGYVRQRDGIKQFLEIFTKGRPMGKSISVSWVPCTLTSMWNRKVSLRLMDQRGT